MTIYLAGAMAGLTYEEMNNWRVKAKSLLSEHHCISPVDFYNFEINRDTFTDLECMLFDLTAVKKSDLILVNLSKNSIGTAIELYEAFSKGTPVIGFDAHSQLHPWEKECCYKICDILENAVEYINTYYGAIL